MNEVNKIIFFTNTPFNIWDYNRFGIDILRENGFEVEVWDFTPFWNQETNQVKMPDPISYERHYLFFTKKEAISAISKLPSNVLVIFMISYYLDSYPIYRAISKNRIKYCVLAANPVPTVGSFVNSKLALVKYLYKLKKLSFNKLLSFLNNSIVSNYIGIRPADFNLAGGERCNIYYNWPIGKKTKTLWLHALDYDIYLKEKNSSGQFDKRTGVFLDEFVPFHPGYIYMNTEPFATLEEYYPLLCKFFNFLEKEYGFRIIIAAHPRSNYEKHPDYFEGRTVIRGKTAELVKSSGFVLAHASTSINFAILFNKPILFITTDRLEQSMEKQLMNGWLYWLDKKAINLNNNFTSIDIKKEILINEEVYKNYTNLYIKKNGTDELPFWQIFANKIKNENLD